jgi:hypothetical protein
MGFNLFHALSNAQDRGLMVLFKKKLSPAELKTKLAIAEKKLEKREKELTKKRNDSRYEAREALRNGDEMTFRVASRRFALLNNQVNVIKGMVEMATVMLDLVEMQTGLNEVVEIGGLLKGYQKELGIDTKQMEGMLKNMQVSMNKVDAAAEMINNSMEVATAGDVNVSEAQENLKSELMAEIGAEKQGGGLEQRIAAAKRKR